VSITASSNPTSAFRSIRQSVAGVHQKYLNSRIYRHRRVAGISIGMALLSVMFFSPVHWAVAMHHSIKYNLVWWVDDAQAWRDAEYVMVRWLGDDPQNQGITDGMTLVKRIGCRPGGTLSTRNAMVYCDDTFLGIALRGVVSRDSEIKQFVFNGIVPDGKLFLVGDSADSYDSRYFGFVNTSQVYGRVVFGVKLL
jgi:type IV secretory pathway protease TraF